MTSTRGNLLNAYWARHNRMVTDDNYFCSNEWYSDAAKLLEEWEAYDKTDLVVKQAQYRVELHKEAIAERPPTLLSITISPQERNDPTACLRVIEVLKQVKKLYFVPHKYVIEQTSETEDFDGFHIHMSGHTQDYFSNIFKQLKATLNGKKGKPQAQCKVDYANKNWEDEYMMGIKKCSDTEHTPKDEAEAQKARRVRMDALARQKYNLQVIYDYEV